MLKPAFLAVIGTLGLGVLMFSISCTKNPVTPPIHDTINVNKHDTLTTDTLFPPKPDTTVNLNKGLLLYLPFSGNIADSSGNGNPTTAIGTVLTTDAHGWNNNAFGATGNGEEVVVTNNGSIAFDTAFSLSYGFMVRDTVATQIFMSLVNPVNGYGATFDIGLFDPTSNYFGLGVGDVNNSCNAIVTNNLIDTIHWTPNPGSWYNCISIYHKGNLQTYLNGKLLSSKNGSGTAAIVCPSAQFIVGGWWNGDKLSMNGKLDNLRLYNRVLTPHEIVALSSYYQVNSNSVKPGLRTH